MRWEHGLVDQLGSLDDAVAIAAELANLQTGEYGRFEIAPAMSPTEQMILDLLEVSASLGLDLDSFGPKRSVFDAVLSRVERAIQEVARFNDPKGAYSHCFCELE